MNCTNPEIGRLMGRYEFGLLSPEEQKEFEAHLLECEACFEELYSMAPVVQTMREKPDLFLRELVVKEASYFGILKKVKKWWQQTASGVKDVLKPGVEPKAKPVPSFFRVARVGIPVALVIVVATILVVRHVSTPEKFAPLAVIERAYYKPVVVRTAEEYSEAERLFDEGMKFYNQAEYSKATTKLSTSVEKNPNNADAYFYLGVCYLLQGQADMAINHIKKAIELDGKALLEKCHWYLGNAYLVKGDGNRALEEFKKVVDFEGEYEFEAKEMISKIEAHR